MSWQPKSSWIPPVRANNPIYQTMEQGGQLGVNEVGGQEKTEKGAKKWG